MDNLSDCRYVETYTDHQLCFLDTMFDAYNPDCQMLELGDKIMREDNTVEDVLGVIKEAVASNVIQPQHVVMPLIDFNNTLDGVVYMKQLPIIYAAVKRLVAGGAPIPDCFMDGGPRPFGIVYGDHRLDIEEFYFKYRIRLLLAGKSYVPAKLSPTYRQPFVETDYDSVEEEEEEDYDMDNEPILFTTTEDIEAFYDAWNQRAM